jgi:hypothetical protein
VTLFFGITINRKKSHFSGWGSSDEDWYSMKKKSAVLLLFAVREEDHVTFAFQDRH